MKQTLLLALLLIAAFVNTKAQGMLTPIYQDTSPIGGYADAGDIVLHATVQNNTGNAINLKWQRISNSLESGWQSLICDNETCWGPNTNTNTVPLNPGQSSTMDCHFKPLGIPGTGTVTLRVWAVSDSAATAITMSYQCNAYIVGISDPFPKGTLRMYPNPARDYMNVSFSSYDKIKNIEIYDIIGAKVASYTIPSNTETYYINTQDLKEGMYFMSLYNEQKKRLITKVFSKVE